ncbi:hypothetical protein CP971_34470 [Streptomyces viridifaciens]|nr:hypothetical protein CP971_34470 [Streptomyces viridifaciens]
MDGDRAPREGGPGPLVHEQDLPVLCLLPRRRLRADPGTGRARACPAAAPKPSRPGPGRPAGSKHKHRAKHHDVGKTAKRAESISDHQARRD